MIYTGTDDIYFLNDRNIAVGTEESCAAGFNAVPSQSAFVAKYGELIQADAETNVSVAGISAEVSRYEQTADAQLRALSSWLSDRVETSCASICAAVEGLQTSAQAHQEDIAFLSGRVDERLCLSGGVLSNSLSVQNGLTAESLYVDQRQSGAGSEQYTTVSSGRDGFSVSVGGARKIRLDAKDGAAGVIVGGQSLCGIVSSECQYVRDYADGLKREVVSADGVLSSDSTVFGAKAYADAKSAGAEVSAKSYADQRIAALTASVTNGDAGSTVEDITETDGVVAATFRKIQVEQSQVTGLNEELSVVSLKATDFVQRQGDADANYTILSSGSSGFVLSTDRPDVDISFGDASALHRVRFGGRSLCAVISSDARRQIEGLDFAELTASPSQTIKSVRQDDGVVSAQVQDIRVAQSQVEGLTGDVAQIRGNLTGDAEGSVNARIAALKGADSDLSTAVTVHGVRNYATMYVEQVSAHISATIYDKVRTAYRPMGSVSSYSVLEDYQRRWQEGGSAELSSHIGEVYNNLSSTAENPNISGQNFVFVEQADQSGIRQFRWDKLGGIVDFSNFYTKQEADSKAESLSALLTGYVKHDVDALSAETKRLSGNADAVSSDLDSVKGYVHQLSAQFVDPDAGTKGIVRQLSDDIAQTSADVKDVSAHADALQGYVDYLSATPETAGRVGAVPRLSGDVDRLSADSKTVSSDLDSVKGYVHQLSVWNTIGSDRGIIQNLSNHIDELHRVDITAIKLKYHLQDAAMVSANTVSAMFQAIDEADKRVGHVYNGALYDVDFNNAVSATTKDGMTLFRGDRMVIFGDADDVTLEFRDLAWHQWGSMDGNVYVYGGESRSVLCSTAEIEQRVLDQISSSVSGYVENKVSALTSAQDAILSVASELSGLKKVQMTGSYVGGGTFSVYVLSAS